MRDGLGGQVLGDVLEHLLVPHVRVVVVLHGPLVLLDVADLGEVVLELLGEHVLRLNLVGFDDELLPGVEAALLFNESLDLSQLLGVVRFILFIPLNHVD